MSARSSTSWLIGGLLLVILLGLAGALLPIRACRSCDGLALYLHQLTSPYRGTVPLPRIDCPDCGDRGKVSLFRSWMRPRVSITIAGVLRELKDPQGRKTTFALRQVVQDSGSDYAGFLKAALSQFEAFSGARFVESEQQRYLLLFANSGSGTIPGSMGVTVLLLSAEGRALDFVDVLWSSYRGPLSASVPDGRAQIVIESVDDHRASKFERPFEVTQWEGKHREGKAGGNELGRLEIRGGRLHVVSGLGK